MEQSYSQIVSLIWNIADDVLRDVFLRGQYRDVILPMVVLRRLDALLEPTKDEVDAELEEERQQSAGGELEDIDEIALTNITGLSFYNTSKWTLNRLKSQASDNNNILYDNFVEYLNGFSANVHDVLKNFDYFNKAKKLADNDRLLAIIERITDPRINLTDKETVDSDGLPLPALTNVGMGTIFEELLRKFNEENNEEAGEHFTPRDVISLLAHLIFEPVKNNLPKVISLYDPACGSGGMLTECMEYLIKLGLRPGGIDISGTEINPETYAICKSDLIIKGVNPEGIHLGNTITEDYFSDSRFGFIITNPPYGKSWKTDKEKIYHDKTLLDHRFEVSLPDFAGVEQILDATPRTSDGQLLFILEEVDKMKSLDQQPQGSRIASIHNGSSLFTGDAGSGESNTRRYLVENDLVDAIIQLPNNIFYNTGITTYVWVITNKKSNERKGKIQLIDASQAYEKLRKNQGNRNCTVTPDFRDDILKAYIDFKEHGEEAIRSKIFDNDDFRFNAVTIERPLRLRSQFNVLKIEETLFDKAQSELSHWLFDTYGDEVFSGVEKHLAEIKNYLADNEIKLTDKKLASLTSTKKWNERKLINETAYALIHTVGTDIWMDFNAFLKRIEDAAKELGLNVPAKVLNAVARAMSETDPNAECVIKKEHKNNTKAITTLTESYGIKIENLPDYGLFPTGNGTWIEYETDSDLRDIEKIPVKEDIYNYFLREVRPYVEDAWINLPVTKIGCEISFNKYFYQPAPLRTLAENEADILALDARSQGFIQSLFNK